MVNCLISVATRTRPLACVLALAAMQVLVSGCGQKGPLKLGPAAASTPPPAAVPAASASVR